MRNCCFSLVNAHCVIMVSEIGRKCLPHYMLDVHFTSEEEEAFTVRLKAPAGSHLTDNRTLLNTLIDAAECVC